MKIIFALILIVISELIKDKAPPLAAVIGFIGSAVIIIPLFRWLFGWIQSIYPGDFDVAFFKALGKALGKALVTIISLPFLLLGLLLKGL